MPNAGGYHRALLISTAIAAFLWGAGNVPANAQSVTAQNNVSPGGTTTPDWIVGGDLFVGNTSQGELTILNGGTVNNDTGFVGNGVNGVGAVTVSGVGGGGASRWTNSGDLVVGQSGDGTLNIQNGGLVTNQTGYVGADNGSISTVTVSGYGSTWNSTGALGQLNIGDNGDGSLTIQDGGVVNVDQNAVLGLDSSGLGTGVGSVLVTGRDINNNASTWNVTGNMSIGGTANNNTFQILDGGEVNSGAATIGDAVGSLGVVTVSGRNANGYASAWNSGNIYAGYQGTGTLNIEDGAAVAATVPAGSASLYIGYDPGAAGVVNVSSTTSNASTVTVGGALEVGYSGSGSMTVDKGGLVIVRDDLHLARFSGSDGVLEIKGDATGRGVIETGSVIRGAGNSADLHLNGGVLRANKNEADFLDGFAALAVDTGGAWFDTNGYDIGIGTDFSGSSTFNKLGLGRLTLTGDSSGFGGATTIEAGTLQLGDGNTTGSLGGDVVNAGELAFNRSNNYIFDGLVSGTGALSQIGTGTTILRAANTYTGGTRITAGTLQLGDGGTSGSILGDVVNDGVLAFNRSDIYGFDGVVSGAGVLNQIGAGTTVLTQANTYTGGTSIQAGTLQLGDGGTTGSILGDVANDGILAFNRSNAVTFDGMISGTGGVHQIGTGRTTLTGNSSGLIGLSQVSNGALSVNGTLGGTMEVLGGRLQGIGQVGGTTNFAGGTIAPGNSIGTLTIAGDYVGSGGTLEIETVLGDDASATDRLVVLGNTSGATYVEVVNVGGTGAQTNEGIRIVDVAGTSAADSFTLLGSYVFEGAPAVVGGAYAYRLYQGGTSNPGDGDWYLRSALRDPGTSSGPLYQAGAPIYEAYAAMLQSFNGLETLQQRAGNRSWTNGVIDTGILPDAAGANKGIWGRIIARHSSMDPKSSTTLADHGTDIWQLQAGADAQVYTGEAGNLIGGLSLRYGTASADITSIFGNGSIGSTGYGLGGTLTWYGASGFYLDAQANLNWYDSDLFSSTAATSLVSGNGGFGYALGVEAGQQIALGPNWSITPQAQLIYSAVDYDSFADTFGATVSLADGDDLKIRLGISADYQNTWTDETGQTSRLHAYGVANLYYDILPETTTGLAGIRLIQEREAFWGGVGFGGTYSWGKDKYALHGEATVNTSLGNFGGSYDLAGTLGINVKF